MATDIIARALALSNSGSSDPSSGLFLGYVKNGDSFPTTRSDGSPLQNEDYVKPSRNAEFPFDVGDITFENRLTKAFVFNGRWEVDPGLIQDTGETPVSNPLTESYSKQSTNQQKINKENVLLFKELKDALTPIITITTNREVIKTGTSTPTILTVEAVKKGTDIKSVSILRNGISIVEKTDDIRTGIKFSYTDNINATVKYKARIVDIEDRVFDSEEVEVIAVRPAYKGVLSDSANLQELPLHKDANAEVAYSFDYDAAIYKYPKEFGELTSILAITNDQAYENYLESFIKTEDTANNYYIYTMANKCKLVNYKFKFIKQ